MPNATGDICTTIPPHWTTASGIIYNLRNEREWAHNGHTGVRIAINLSRVSNQYQYINEVRVKSIISNGFIKLY